MMGIPFTGFVEGMGYVLPEVVVTASSINNSGTQFMLDINIVSYTFDLSDLNINDDSSTREQAQGQTDRGDYWSIPNVSKFEYKEDWYNSLNIAAFVDNVAIDLINPIIDILNTALITSPQVVYNEGWSALGSDIWSGAKATVMAPYDYVMGTIDYISNTPASQQWNDLKRDLSNPHMWESGVAMGIGFYYGARGSGMMPKAQTPIKTVPNGAYIPKLNYPVETTSDGFLFGGFTINTPINLPVQRFGFINSVGSQHWGIQLGTNKFITRFFFAIKTEWNPLTSYTSGTIPKGTSIKIGIVGPQFPIYKYPGGSIQIIVKSNSVINTTTKTVNSVKK